MTEKVVFVGLTPVDEPLVNPLPYDTASAYTFTQVRLFNETLIRFCEEHRAACIDIWSEWVKADYRQWLCDGLHPNAAAAMSAYIAPYRASWRSPTGWTGFCPNRWPDEDPPYRESAGAGQQGRILLIRFELPGIFHPEAGPARKFFGPRWAAPCMKGRPSERRFSRAFRRDRLYRK